MQENVRKQIRKAKERKKRMRRLCAIILCLSILVAGTVSWQLVLPGVAMSGETYCGKEEHTHSEACYGKNFICGKEEGVGAHTHTEDCYTEVRTDELICGQEESPGHTHTEECYTAPQELTCGQEEYPEHTHTEECYATIQELTCEQEESPEHAHTDDCYTEVRTDELICGQEESPGHTHTEECYTAPQELTCGQEEHPEHIHTEECYATDQKLTCDQEENEGHVHTDECCETGTELTCGQEEHTHSAQCYSNPDAVETEDEWKAAFAEYQLTGEWGKDIAAIAKSQVGYAENTENYSVSEDGSQKGYTRYADWAGDDLYGDWDAYFAAFVLSYAGVPEDQFPVNAEDPEQWITDMQNSGYYTTDAKMEAGDLVILEKTDQDRAQQFGIISEVETDEDGNADTIKVVEGNVDNEVKENTYSVSGGEIVGYGLVSAAYEAYTGGSQSTDTTPDTDDTLSNKGEELETGKSNAVFSSNTLGILPQDDDSTVNERLVVTLEGRNGIIEGESGETLYATVVSGFSGANQGHKVTVYIDIGALPEGVSIAGFVNGQREVVYEAGGEKQSILLQLVEEDGKYYVCYTQPQGSTIEFTLQFNSKNGIMDAQSDVTISVAEDKITGLEGGPGATDRLDDEVTLTWNAGNEWDPVDKKVDNADYRELLLDENNKLNDTLTYTIKANSSNNENYGEIWTEYIEVTDTLTLPDTISFPEGAKVSDDKTKIVDASGNTIIEFTNLQGGEVKDLTLSGKIVTYTLQIPNQHMENGVPTAEQDNLSLEMKFDTSKLIVDEGVKKTDRIVNDVKIQPVPYKKYDVESSEDSVYVVTTETPEDFELKKTANQSEVKAGDVIKYTLTLENTGKVAIEVKDEDDNYYTVKDTLPKYLMLTEQQIQDLAEKNIEYDKETGTLSWIPSQEDIKPGETKKVEFECTVKEADNPDMIGLVNGSSIQNTAEYKGKYADSTIPYKKGEVTVKKEADKTTVENGDEITYTITVSNSTSLPADAKKLIDTLPKGLSFLSAEIGTKADIHESGTYEYHDEQDETHQEKHNVEFGLSEDNQTLSWYVGTVAAGETIVLKYTCKVNTDELENPSQINNTVSFENGGGSSSSGTGVDGPIDLKKELDDADQKPVDGVYPNKTIFTYKITVTNDEKNPSKEAVIVTDDIPSGMIPIKSTLKMLYTDNAGSHSEEISWPDFIANTYDKKGWNQSYQAEIGGYIATVTRQGDGSIRLQWNLGVMEAGKEIVLSYQTQLNLSDEQIANGGTYEFTNKVYTRDKSDSVTVKGGTPVGKLRLYKTIDGQTLNQIPIPDKYKNIKFVISGVDQDGTVLNLKGVKSSSYNSSDPGFVVSEDGQSITVKYSAFYWIDGMVGYELSNLPLGTYTITEQNAEVDGTTPTVTFTVNDQKQDGGDQIQIKAEEITKVVIDNTYKKPASVDIQKSVYGIYDVEVGPYNTQWELNPSKSIFSTALAGGIHKYVVYNITVINTGDSPVEMDTLIDELPRGVHYKGIFSNAYNNLFINFSNTAMTLGAGNNPLNEYYANNLQSVYISASYDDTKNRINMLLRDSENDSDGISLEEKKAFTFLVVCEIADDVTENAPLENTAKVVVDNDVSYVDYPEIRVTNGSYYSYQNNGSSKDEGRDSADTGKHYISSSVIITPENAIVPGIKKEATHYIESGKTEKQEIKDDSNILPNTIVRWEITLYNDGTEPITEYTIADVVEEPFKLISEEYLTTTEGQALKSVLDDLYQFKVEGTTYTLEAPKKSSSEYSFRFTDEKYTIAPGKSATLVIYTYNTTEEYKTYRNTATFLPKDYEKIDANSVTHGELVKDENGQYIGVKAADEVNALGQYASLSWKTITEKGTEDKAEPNTARGDDEINYIVVDRDKDVTYTNNVYNSSQTAFKDFVMIDLMPSLNDTGVINQNDIRGSEFTVAFAENLKIYKVSDGNEPQEIGSYKIQYSSKMSFTDADFKGEDNTVWHNEWQDTDKSFRIVFNGEFRLDPRETLVVQYDGKIQSDASPGDIAWNSFGYSYRSEKQTSTSSSYMRAEPPKVGVMIPGEAIIKKIVVDSNNEEQSYDATKTFTFEITQDGQEIGTIKLCQGGYMKLSELEDAQGNPISLEYGKTYTIEEIDVPENYTYVGIGPEGGKLEQSYTFTYYSNQTIVIAARNKVESYQYELPETGGIGTTGYFTGGAALMLASGLLGGTRMRRKRERRGR